MGGTTARGRTATGGTDGDGRHNNGKGQQGDGLHNDGDGRYEDAAR